jgi:transposase-like protein
MNYTQGFKNRMVQRMAGPEGITACALARETGLQQPTLSRWLREARNFSGMSKKSSQKKSTRTPMDKLRILAEATRLSDEELGAFLRKEGVHEATLVQWQEAAALALEGAAKPRKSKRSPEAKRITQLERELDRKEKALAELAALITLQKKVRAIWGDEGDATTRRSEP